MLTFSHRCRRLFVWLILSFLAVQPPTAVGQQAAAPSADKPLRIHMIGAGEYSPVESLTSFKSYLEQNYRVECTTSWSTENIATHLDNLDQLKIADVLVLFARRMKLPDEEMAVIRNHWQQGKPIVAMRTASHAFQPMDNAVWDQQVLGGHYRGASDYRTPFKAIAATGQAEHPVLKGVGPIASRGYYGNGKLADDAIVVQVIDGDERARPVSWVHTYNGGRTFYTSMGVPTDFEDENFRRLLANAVLWTAHSDPERMKK
jgi:type 1 glutamine amidotransferase